MIIMFRIQLCRNGDDAMELEMDVEDLLNKRKLESDRIEFKTGWNPDDIYHSVCAFANDYNNDGGGYIVVGVEEENGENEAISRAVAKENVQQTSNL